MELLELDFETLEACPVCGSKEIAFAYSRKGIYTKVQLGEWFCGSCHQIFLNPRMTDDQTKRYYAGDYRNIVSKDKTGIKENNLATQKMRADFQVILAEAYIKNCKTNLEIGCSAGHLMNNLHEQYGMECVGIEPDTRYHYIEPASKFTVYSDIAEVPKGQTFDLITLSHSLEHLNHPGEYIEYLIANHCHKGTVFVVEVPNTEYYTLSIIHHPMSFSPETLNGLFNRAGAKTVANGTHGLGEILIYKYLVGVYEVKG